MISLSNVTIYVDMDGVLADFDKFIIEQLGCRFDEFPDSKTAWKQIEHIPNIYELLDVMPEAPQLVSMLRDIQLAFSCKLEVLTAVPKIGRVPLAKQHKREWIRKHFPYTFGHVNIGPHAEHKQYHALPGDILIDDMQRNIDQWNSKDGCGILYTTVDEAKRQLARYLKEIKS